MGEEPKTVYVVEFYYGFDDKMVIAVYDNEQAAIDYVEEIMKEMTSRERAMGYEYTYTPFVLNQPDGYNYPTSKGE